MIKKSFNDSWEFTTIDSHMNTINGRDMTIWKNVTLPHDWTTDFEFNHLNISAHQGGHVQTGIGWYRKYFMVSKNMLEKEMILLFDGIYNRATISVNGHKVGGRDYGYSTFDCDITSYLKEGLNQIVVKVDCSKEPSSRWFNGAGITRKVWILQGEHQYIPYNGINIRIEDLTRSSCHVRIDATIINKQEFKNAVLQINITNQEGHILQSEKKAIVLECGSNFCQSMLILENPELWDCEQPNLYNCVLKVMTEDGQDKFEQTFGVRSIEFKANEGFFLNEKHTLFKGVCLHHDGGCVGSAVPSGLWRKRILMLKEMGCNAIRVAHNPFNPEFYDICDEVGMLVIDEAFDGWSVAKVKNDYSVLWEQCHEQDLKDFIIRDRNHPSIVLWSIGNEVLKMKPTMTRKLMDIVKKLDDTRKITAGVNDISEASDSNRAVLDVAGYNDGGGACFLYEEDHQKRPSQLMIATEAPHTQQTRGFYRTQTWWRDKNQPRIEIPNLTNEEIFFDQSWFYNSSYDNAGVRTCSRDSWSFVEKYPYLCGEFRWTGFDYIGEALPNAWPARTNNYGIIDLANFEKDHYYLYQSMWSEKKMIHLLPHWTHRYMEKGTIIPVWVYTNCEEAELFLNGKNLGKKKKGDLKNLEWLVSYAPGIIEVIGYENKEEMVKKSYRTATTPENLVFTSEVLPDKSATKVAQWTFEIIDKNDNYVPYSNNITSLYLSEGIELIGSDNGAIDDMSFWKSSSRKAFNGLGMYLVRYQKNIKNGYGAIAFILGDSYFDEETKITLGIRELLVSEFETNNQYDIYYTLDGNTPNKSSEKYHEAFIITESTYIKIVIYKGDEAIIKLGDLFTKGRLEPIIDLTHLNYQILSETPVGPFSEKLFGEWYCNGILYRIKEDGTIIRIVGIQETLLGYWWYDFPTDFLETPNYAGTGEFWFTSGEVCKITLADQSANTLIMDNTKKAIAATYCIQEKLIFTKSC